MDVVAEIDLGGGAQHYEQVHSVWLGAGHGQYYKRRRLIGCIELGGRGRALTSLVGT